MTLHYTVIIIYECSSVQALQEYESASTLIAILFGVKWNRRTISTNNQ